MAYKKITLNNIDNVSLQVGDVAYYTSISTPKSDYDSFNPLSTGTDLIEIGKIHEIGSNYIIVESNIDTFGIDDFIVFSKDKDVNNTSLLGYYAEIKLSNNSLEKAELFSLSSEVTPSSK